MVPTQISCLNFFPLGFFQQVFSGLRSDSNVVCKLSLSSSLGYVPYSWILIIDYNNNNNIFYLNNTVGFKANIAYGAV